VKPHVLTKEELEMAERELEITEIMELLCAPEATDELEDLDFDDADDFDEKAERDFVEDWILEEMKYKAGIAQAMKGMVIRHD
jgi:hypothetical protein